MKEFRNIAIEKEVAEDIKRFAKANETKTKTIQRLLEEYSMMVNRNIEAHITGMTVICADDCHCPIMCENWEGVLQGMPSLECTNGMSFCQYYVSHFCLERWPWLKEEERKKTNYVVCSYPKKRS